ncbi:unnamed protein product [Prunus armeniaca]|uniref:Reverse transcriptase domain-containing protein n=1 Tax=Prunus armeniaca TaxID=36596 RepID=A0A6J5U8M3_PRUAR|nr:unnamed protein product [Prunus armeniaca]CAB4303077.1 unnamed protein product [Prunus armeniaca]
MRSRRGNKVPRFALKLDMANAFDRVEWNFLCKMMEKLGKGLLKLISSHKGGLDKEIPFSLSFPHLCRGIFFTSQTGRDFWALKKVFQIYGSAVDQKINFDKSAIAFSPNAPMQLRNELRKKLNGWKELLLSKAEKSILINAVAQRISNYAMFSELPKDEGGLGFRDLEIFNKALVAKQCWRLLTNELSMIHKADKGRASSYV